MLVRGRPSNRRRRGRLAVVTAAALVAAACSADSDATRSTGAAGTAIDVRGSTSDEGSTAGEPEASARPGVFRYPQAPPAPAGDDASNTEAAELVDRINDSIGSQAFDFLAVSELGAAGDPRHAWYLSDLLRFFGGAEGEQLVTAFEALTGADLDDDPDRSRSPWLSATNHLMAWDTPDYPGYQDDKAGIYSLVEPAWEPFFADDDADIDWRLLSWGGVLIDDRALGDTESCPRGCIPALDDPAVTDAEGGEWYPDDRVVFGIVEGEESLAIPLNIAEVHEMFNLTLGGRRLGIPYCTLCGSAQAYYTDELGGAVPDGEEGRPAGDLVLRTTGLLSRSNKVMYDLVTRSAFDTFTGAAVSGALQDAGVALTETTVVRSSWGEWKADHPDTAVIAADGGIGRSYPLDPLGDRDANGPIFPVGAIDDRVDEQELVVGVISTDGTPVAFPSDAATLALELDRAVEAAGVTLTASGDGLVAMDSATGEALAAHEAFWFAWSHFRPDTELWVG